ncbi:serine-rich adhesin for platelets isoform X1 [Drosophila pseudoobscura]|uniref:Serine-rich adhesin for platelets isoform X1 n=1 Tax=Drosophila pseudoobscura pseudoobscura TaxID=46245 RepID=A0A6I8UZX7_DROPS|nr:serine-rich adhesin for platelets isoform X1 [Drosophila pseudoobscura]
MQQQDDPPSLPVGTEVSAKYKGAFCEAKVSKVVRNIKVKVVYKQGLGTGIVPDDAIKAPPGQMRVGAVVEVRHPDRKEIVEATIAKIQDGSQYTVVFDDGDITTLRRTALCLKSGRHFNESETLDQLPLTHPEHFGNPVVGGRRGRRRGQLNEDSSDDDDESDAKEVVNEKEENIGQVVCVETESKKKDKEKWFPALVVAPTAQATVRIRVKDEYLVRSFKDGRYYTVPKKEATEFTREVASKQDVPAVQAALEFLDSSVLPPHWDRDSLFGLSNLTSDDDGEIDSDSSDDEPHEEKDRFVAQLYKYMDDRGTPLNKVPSIQSRDVDLYRLFRAVQKRGGYNRVTTQNQWKMIAVRLGFAPCTVSVMNLVKQAYKKFLQPYGDFHRKLGCSMLMTSRNSNRSKGRSLVRANSVASPKPMETTKTETISKLAQPNQTATITSTSSSSAAAAATSSTIGPTLSAAASAARAASTASISAAEESENTSESSVVVEPIKKQRKASAAATSTQQQGKVKSLVEKYEEKSSAAMPLAATAAATGAAGGGGPTATVGSGSSTTTSAASAAASAAGNTTSTATPSSLSSGAAAAAATPSAAVGKDTESDLPLSKIKLQAAAATAAAVTRNSMEKDQQTNISPGSATSSKANSADNQRSRDASPSATPGPSAAAAAPPTIAKKEKHQRKQVEKPDEKQRGKRKKEDKDISVEKIDTGDFVVGIGDKLKVNYHEKKSPSSHGSTYEAKVIEISVQRGVPMYLVHYTGWNNRYDEWVPRERIAENLTKGSKQKTRTISTSSANSGSGGGGGGGGTGSGAGSQGTLPPGPGGGGDKQPPPGKDGPSKTAPPTGAAGQQGGQSGNPSGFSTASSLIQAMVKTPTTTGAKRGRGRSDSMPPRSTTPSSVASNSSRTKSPASSQQQQQQQHQQKQPMKRRPTRGPTNSANIRISDASMASESDSDSDEPVRRPKRQSAKEKAAGKPQATAKGRLSRVPSSGPTAAAAQQSPSEESDEDEEEEDAPGLSTGKQQPQQQPPPSLQRSRAAGNRAMSSGAATSKGRDYDLSEIRSELKGFQPQLLSSSSSSSALPIDERKDHIKGESHAPAGDIKKEPKVESSAKSSSTEASSETDSYVDEDSQSSDYRKHAGEKRTKAGAAGQTPGKAGQEPPSSADSIHLLETIKTETKDIKVKPFHTGADIKPTTSLIAPARFGLNSSSSVSALGSGSSSSTSTQGPCLSAVAKYTPVIVEKPLTMTTAAASSGSSSSKKSAQSADQQHPNKKVDSLKKQSGAGPGGATATASSSSSSSSNTTGQEAKKFAEPVATLKVELPAACSPSSSSSSSSSFCSSASGGSSSSATRSLPDMSKLEISGGAGGSGAAGPSGTQPATPPTATATASSKETKYSSSSITAASGGPLTLGDLLASDVYEFKDTEPFEFEKRISPMAACSTTATGVASVLPSAGPSSVITVVPPQSAPAPAAAAAGGGAGAGAGAPPGAGTTVVVSSAARKQALKATALQHSLEQHQLPPNVHGAAAAAATVAAAGLGAGKSKKRGSPLKEASLVLEKPKLIKVEKEQPEQKPAIPQQQQQQQQAPPTVKVVAATATHTPTATPNLVQMQQKLITPPGGGGGGSSSASSAAGQLTPGHHATPFDALRKSPSFNLNIMALNEELAQTVQETTRALTDALQPPTTPISATAPPAGPLLICPGTPPTGGGATSGQVAASPKLSTPPQSQTKPPPPPTVVGSPFIETRNVFELSTSNEGSGYSSGESKDNKLEKLENVKILLAGAAGLPFDLDAAKYEQKTSSIADKVLKAISQKKEEVENNKSKPPAHPHTEATPPTGTGAGAGTGTPMMIPKLLPDIEATPLILPKPEPCTSSKLEALKMLSEPLKIQTGPLLGELYRPGPATNSPETKSILDSMPAKNNELSETIQKLECAIQQRKTPVSGLSLASSTAGTPPTAHTPNSTVTVGVGGFSDESMDSTDSEQRLVIEDVIVEDHTTTTTAEQKSPGSQEELAETMDRTISTPTPPVKMELMGSKQLCNSGIQAPIALKLAQGEPSSSSSSFAGKLAAVTQPPPLAKLHQHQQQQHHPEESSKMGTLSSFGIPIVVPEIPASVVMATPSITIPAFTIPMEQDQDSPPIMACTSSPASPSPPTVSSDMGDRLGSGLLLKTYIEPEADARSSSSSYHQQQQSTAVQTEIVLSNTNVSTTGGWIGRGAEITSDATPVVARPFVMHAVNKEMYNVVANTAAPAASSPLINDPHNETINLLCEETIPGSPAPTYGGKDEQMAATASSALAITGITPLSPDTPPPGTTGLLQGTTGAHQSAGDSALGGVGPSTANSSPDSASQEDESSEEAKTKHLENELEGLGLGGTLRKRKRPSKQTQAQITAVAAQLQSLSKRRRQVSGMRGNKPIATVTAAGSDTDDNSDNLVSNLGTQQQQSAQQQQLRQSGRQQLMPLTNAQQQQQQQQQQLQQHQQQQQQPQLQQQQQQPSSSNQLGVRPCPYNFLVELDRSLSSDQCITILRKQIQDLRKAYNTIKGELAVIDRRRKKMRRREREKKQQQQQQGQTQGKVCT